MLRKRVLTRLTIIEGVIFGLFVLGFLIIFNNFERLEQQTLATNLVRVHSALQREWDLLDHYNYQWSSTGAIYFGIRNTEPFTVFYRNMALNNIVGSFDFKYAAIFDTELTLIGAKELNPTAFTDIDIDIEHEFIQALLQNNLAAGSSEPITGFLVDNSELYLVSAQPVLSPIGAQTPRGTLVIARHYDQESIRQLSNVVKQDVSISPVSKLLAADNIGPSFSKLIDANQTSAYSPLNDKTMGTFELLEDINGNRSIGLVIKTPRSIILQARDTVVAISAGLLLFFMFRVFYVLFFLDKSILLRLKTVSGNVENLTTQENIEERLDIDGDDEFYHLANSFNGLLDALENSQSSLRSERDKAETTLDSITDAVITTDLACQVTYMNRAALEFFPAVARCHLGRKLEDVFSPTDDSGLTDEVNLAQRCINEKETIRENQFCHIQSQDGDTIILESLASPILSAGNDANENAIAGVVIVFRDVSHARRLQQNLIYQASHDGLTNLYNRSEFERQLTIVAKSANKNNQNHHLIFIDLDRFKLVNDSCGHMAGDNVLREISQLMQAQIRKTDILARIGGDEFAIILMDCKFARAYDIAEKVREAIANFRFASHDKSFTFGASIGFVNLKDQQFNDDMDLLSMADKACMAAKNSGRNRIHIYRSEDSHVTQHQEHTRWVSRVTDALEHDNFVLYYQKIAPANSNDTAKTSAEILIRMLGADNEIIAPGAFLPAAERYGLMKFIDKWVIEHFCEWAADNPSVFDKIPVFSINLSGQSLSDAEFLSYLVNYFATPPINPKQICFEITETSAIQNIANARKFINRLKEMGFSFSLDDFGSGMSSFSYLKHLAVDALKIDGAFIKNIEREAVDHSMVRSINDIGHVMGIQTVAEFVESESICNMVVKLGIDYVQGYHIHKPQPLEHLVEAKKRLSGF